MTTQQLNVLVILAERARKAGLITFDEFGPVAEAVAAATKAMQEGQKREETPVENPGEAARERGKK